MIYRNVNYRNVCCDNKSTHNFQSCKILIALGLQSFLDIEFQFSSSKLMMLFCPKSTFNIAKLGSETWPNWVVCAIDFHPHYKKSPGAAGAFLFADLPAEKGLSAE
jgi:hypothetical protein